MNKETSPICKHTLLALLFSFSILCGWAEQAKAKLPPDTDTKEDIRSIKGPLAVTGQETPVVNGVPWFDKDGNIINAHGACIVKDQGKYWLFGEYKSDEENAFFGFSCYSSTDLVNWHFEGIPFKQQKDGLMGPGRVGERVKVMRCPKTGEYVMFMHSDNQQYKDPHTCYATCKTINGTYTFQGPVLFNGNSIKRWDMGTFQDDDGSGYLLIHHGPIYRLSDDYHSIAEKVADVKGAKESPAMLHAGGTYFLLTSNLTSWEKNDNFYFSAPSIRGPWKYRGYFCPKGTLTYNSQSTFVLPVANGCDTTFIYMGDRWAYPHQASAATYVWMPLQIKGDSLSIPVFYQAWNIKNFQPEDILAGKKSVFNKVKATRFERQSDGSLRSNEKGAVLRVRYDGNPIALLGKTGTECGVASVRILDSKKRCVYTSLLDYYTKVPEDGIRFITPPMNKRGKYTLEIEVMGEHSTWTDKSNTIFGSKDDFVDVSDIIVL